MKASRLRQFIEWAPDDCRIRPLFIERHNLLLSDIAADTAAANLIAQEKVISLTRALFWLTLALTFVAAIQVNFLLTDHR